jgi:hypothetical protein
VKNIMSYVSTRNVLRTRTTIPAGSYISYSESSARRQIDQCNRAPARRRTSVCQRNVGKENKGERGQPAGKAVVRETIHTMEKCCDHQMGILAAILNNQ